jgi:hypothetical protein
MRLTRTVSNCCAEHTYPTTTAKLIDDHGETRLALPNGAVTLGEVLGRLPSHDLETPEDAEHTIYSALSEDAIGRKEYSDRDPRCPGEGTSDQVSL